MTVILEIISLSDVCLQVQIYFPSYSIINTAKKKHATVTASSSQSILIDDLDSEDADDDLYANAMALSIVIYVY